MGPLKSIWGTVLSRLRSNKVEQRPYRKGKSRGKNPPHLYPLDLEDHRYTTGYKNNTFREENFSHYSCDVDTTVELIPREIRKKN